LNKTLDQFNLRLDRMLSLSPAQTGSPATSDPSVEAALQTAGLLTGLDLATEAAPRPELRQRWARANAKPPTAHPGRSRLTRRLAWVVALIIALALLAAFRQPVLAAVGRLFGYIYVQDSGFLPVDSTLVLQQPVLPRSRLSPSPAPGQPWADSRRPGARPAGTLNGAAGGMTAGALA